MSLLWWDGKNLDKPRRDKSGTRWHFRVWHERATPGHVAVFFWNDKRDYCGIKLFKPGEFSHIADAKSCIQKLTADASLREKYRRPLRFPLDRHYKSIEDFQDGSE